MKIQKIILIIAILLLVSPFLGFPNMFQDIIVFVSGLLIIVFLNLKKINFSKKTDNISNTGSDRDANLSSDEFSESIPEASEPEAKDQSWSDNADNSDEKYTENLENTSEKDEGSAEDLLEESDDKMDTEPEVEIEKNN